MSACRSALAGMLLVLGLLVGVSPGQVARHPDVHHDLAATDGVLRLVLEAADAPRTAWVACDTDDVSAVLIDASGAQVQADSDGGPLNDARLVVPAGGGPWIVEARVSAGSSARIVVRLEAGDVPLPEGHGLAVLEALRRAEIAEAMVRQGDGAAAVEQVAFAGMTLFNLGESRRSTPVLARATELAAQHQREDLVPHLAVLAAHGLAEAGQLDECERHLALGAALLAADGPLQMRLVACKARGLVAEQRGRLDLAEAEYTVALELAPADWAVGLQRQLADVRSRRGDRTGALAALEAGMLLADASGSADEQARMFMERADVLQRHGEYDEARAALDRAAERAVDPVVRGRVASLRGTLASAEGHFVRARAWFAEAIERFELAGRDELVGRVLYNLAVTALHHGQVDEATTRIGEGLARDLSPRARRWLQALSANVALERADDLRDRVACGAQAPAEAREWLARGLLDVEAARRDLAPGEDPILTVYLHLTEAEIHKDSARPRDERAALLRAQQSAVGTGERWSAMVAVRHADLALREEQPAVALARASDAWERTSVEGSWPEVLAARHTHVAALLRAGDGSAALAAVAETQRLVERPDFVLATDLDVMGFRGRPHYADLARFGQDAVALAASTAEPDRRAELLAAGVRLASDWKAYVLLGDLAEPGATRRDPLTVPRDELGDGEVLVEFSEGREQMYAYVHGDGPTRFHDLGSRCEIARQVDAYRELVSDPLGRAGPAEIATAGRALHERLLSIVPRGAGSLVVVPCASLSALPFEALVSEAPERPRSFDELTFVLDERPVVYAPSIAVFGALSARAPRDGERRVLVLADPTEPSGEYPRLRGTRHEAAAILAAGAESVDVLPDDGALGDGVRVLLGASATAAALKRELGARSILHVGAHGVIDLNDPRGSALLLAPEAPGDDGRLAIADVLALQLQTDLVVLAACDTGRGQVVRGEGVQSLARAFFAAGSRSVMVSLWPVRDSAAGVTMARFYEELFDDAGVSVAEAARRARLAVRRGEIRASDVRGDATRGRALGATGAAGSRGGVHPRDWAPFIVVGPTR